MSYHSLKLVEFEESCRQKCEKKTYEFFLQSNSLMTSDPTFLDFSSHILDFSSHISKIIKVSYYKCFQILRVIRSKNPSIWSKAYKSYVRPSLEYATEIWNPEKKTLVQKIEKVQKFFTRKALKYCGIKYLSYEERLETLNLQPLHLRRKITDLTTFFKICKSLTNLDPKEFVNFSNRPKRKHDYQIVLQHYNSLAKNSFFSRNSNIWNLLPKEIANSQSLIEFKDKIKQFATSSNEDRSCTDSLNILKPGHFNF
jgi:hypothetical protein